ncbi:MAG: sulfatase-like hydrolase/transferase [Phycisphaerales bacterium]|nr:sulfatase-like hydrolase/transferase [Phycisphaerales bacterium]
MSIVRRIALLACAIAFVILSGGCKPDQNAKTEVDASAKSSRKGGQPNVVLISMDTTRPDYLGCYGSPVTKTPNIDRLAKAGTMFTQCTTAAPLTAVSHSSMLTGVFPPVHGVRDNGPYILHPANETLAEALSAEGYFTGASVAAVVLNREIGLNQGFDVYSDFYDRRESKESADARAGNDRLGSEIAEDGIAMLRAHKDESFFLFLHFFDPHSPYEPPEPFRNQYDEKYVAEIAYADAQIGKVLDEIDNLGLTDNTLVVLTADHGESRWEHGEETHAAFVYDATVHIGLIMRYPKVIPAEQTVGAQVRVVDVTPTILDYLGVGVDGFHYLQGTTLRPLITGEETDLGLPAYSETFYTRNGLGFSILRGYRHDGWKYIHAPKPELYDLRKDPKELDNVIDQFPAKAEQLREELRTFLAESPKLDRSGGNTAAQVSDSVAKMQALGYLTTDASAAEKDSETDELAMFEPVGRDPKDYTELLTLVSQTLGRVHIEDPKTEEMLLKCIELAPDPDRGFGWAFVSLGGMCVKQERYDDAIKWYKRALNLSPTDGRILTSLAETLWRAGHTEDAKLMLERALELQPVYAHTYLTLGRMKLADGKLPEALELMQKALEIDPSLPPAHRCMGFIHVVQGDARKAREEYARAVSAAPDMPMWHQEYADLLQVMQEPEEALKEYEAWAKIEPDKALAYAGIGDSYRAMHRVEEALANYRKAYEMDPTLVTLCDAYGQLLLEQGSAAEAVVVLRKGLETAPNHPNLANNLAWLLATSKDDSIRNGAEAVTLAEAACAATNRTNPNFLDTLGAAYAEAGRFDDAIKTVEEVIKAATDGGFDSLLSDAKAHLALYRSGKPVRSS